MQHMIMAVWLIDVNPNFFNRLKNRFKNKFHATSTDISLVRTSGSEVASEVSERVGFFDFFDECVTVESG